MRSKASFKSHPIHPILIVFPIAFFAGTVLCDVVFYFTGKQHYHIMAHYLNIAGIAGGLLAAVPGLIDYKFTVPPDSSAKKRAIKHGLLNTLTIMLFVIALLQRNELDRIWILAIGIIALGTMTIAGWLGGTLVYRNQIGVDPRYADAGKWKEQYFDDTSDLVIVGRTDELQINQMKLLHFSDKRIVLGRTESGYKAFDDRCPHKGGSLAGGSMMCGTVQCPWHGSQFSVENGNVTAGPAVEGIKTYRVEERDENLYLYR